MGIKWNEEVGLESEIVMKFGIGEEHSIIYEMGVGGNLMFYEIEYGTLFILGIKYGK